MIGKLNVFFLYVWYGYVISYLADKTHRQYTLNHEAINTGYFGVGFYSSERGGRLPTPPPFSHSVTQSEEDILK